MKLKNVGYKYPNTSKNALEDLSWNITRNKIYGIVGKSGSGKTTLTHLLNTLILPTMGEIEIDDVIINQEAKKKKAEYWKIKQKNALVLQFSDLQFFELTVLEDLIYGPLNFGMNREEAIKLASLEVVNFGMDESILQRNPFELSGGEKKKLAIIAMLLLKPEVLILDEPTIGLDEISKHEIMDKLLEIFKERDLTIIISSHDYNFLEDYVEEIIEIEDGKKVLEEAKKDFFEIKFLDNQINQLPDIYVYLHAYLDYLEISDLEVKKNIFHKIAEIDDLVNFINEHEKK